MAKQTFSEINVKAAAITGAIIGFLCWLLVIPYGLGGYGMMGGIFHAYSLLSIALDVVLSALIGAVLAAVYNWALKLK